MNEPLAIVRATHWIFGVHAVAAVLRGAGVGVVRMLARDGREDGRMRELLALAGAAGVLVERCGARRFEQLLGDVAHQGVAIEQRVVAEPDEGQLYEFVAAATTPILLLVLDEVTDPRNFGALLRVADGAGVHAVVTTRRRSAPMSALVHKSAAGAATAVPVYRVTNLARALARLKTAGVWIVGLADAAAPRWLEADLRGPCALVVGAEDVGLRRLTREGCDALISIPMQGAASSLNVSVAAGVALYEAWRQRHGGAGDPGAGAAVDPAT